MCEVTHEHVWDQGRRSKFAKESPRNDGHTLGFSIGKAAPVSFCHPQEKFEMSRARRRLRFVRRTSGSCLDAKRVGV